MALFWPVSVEISQQFATNPSSIQPNGHTGIDFKTPLNTPIKAAGSGKVVFANWATTLSANNPWLIAPAYAGITVVIDHGDGLLTLYAHLNKTDLNVNDRVVQGQTIGLSGSTGLSTGPHLHFEVIGWPLKPTNGFYGRLNPNKYISSISFASSITKALEANQRLVGPDNVNMRFEPKTSAGVARVIQANTIETFAGFMRGESVKGNDVWFVDSIGSAWSGGFTSQSTTGLPDVTPKPALKANQRRVGSDNVNHRAQSNAQSEVLRVIPADSVEEFYGYVHGQSIDGNDLWYQDAQGFAWSGGFTTQSTAGLVDIAPKTPAPTPAPAPAIPTPTPTPTPAPQPAQASNGYSFEKDFDFVEYAPAHISNVQAAKDNPGKVVFPPKPSHAVIHQFDEKEKKPSIAGVINHFQTERPGSESSAHFGVSGNRIVQFVSLNDRAYHAGKVGNDYIGIECDPAEDAATVASMKKLLAALIKKYGYAFTYTKHKDVPGNATKCGTDIHLDLYKAEVVVTPEVTKPPVVLPTGTDRQAVQDFVDWAVNEYFTQK